MSFVDSDGLEHSVTVVARTRNEAALRALARFDQSEFARVNGPFRGDRLKVESLIEESHGIGVGEALAWLELRHGTPREIAVKSELRALFGPAEKRPKSRR